MGRTWLECARVLPWPPEMVFDRATQVPPERLFDRGHGELTAISHTTGAPPERWASRVGQTRRLEFLGGGWAREAIVAVSPPHEVRCLIDDIHAPHSRFIDSATLRWCFEPAPGGSVVTHGCELHPTEAYFTSAAPAFSVLWTGYTRQVLGHLERELSMSLADQPVGSSYVNE